MEIVADGMVLGRAAVDRPRLDVAEKHGFAPERAVSFHLQARMPESRKWMGALEMWVIDPDGRRTWRGNRRGGF